jgi:hypothetical protein
VTHERNEKHRLWSKVKRSETTRRTILTVSTHAVTTFVLQYFAEQIPAALSMSFMATPPCDNQQPHSDVQRVANRHARATTYRHRAVSCEPHAV